MLIVRGSDNKGNQLIYDSDRNITWYDFTHIETWENQMAWVSGLEVEFDGTIFDDWRLPSAHDAGGTELCASDSHNNIRCDKSEMGHLYFTGLGLDLNCCPPNTSLWNFQPFKNLEAKYYFTSTEYVDTNHVWIFYFDAGYQSNSGDKFSPHRAMALRDGDVIPPDIDVIPPAPPEGFGISK